MFTSKSEIHEAAKKGDLKALGNLICKERDLNALDKYKKKPIYYACKRGHFEAVKFLLEYSILTQKEEYELRKIALDFSMRKNSHDSYHQIYQLFISMNLYDHIWNKYKTCLEKVEALFRDYFAPDILKGLHQARIQRILTGHWRRRHVDIAEGISNELSNLIKFESEIAPEEIINRVNFFLKTLLKRKNLNHDGSLVRRVTYMENKLNLKTILDLSLFVNTGIEKKSEKMEESESEKGGYHSFNYSHSDEFIENSPSKLGKV